MDGPEHKLTLYKCGTCGRYFASETEIRAHQDLYSKLHAHDPEIDEHDGEPWTVTMIGQDTRQHVGHEFVHVVEVRIVDDERWWTLDTMAERLCFNDQDLAAYVTGSVEAGEKRCREFAAALALGIHDDEVSLIEHIATRKSRWYRPRSGEYDTQAVVESVELLATIGLMIFNEVRR